MLAYCSLETGRVCWKAFCLGKCAVIRGCGIVFVKRLEPFGERCLDFYRASGRVYGGIEFTRTDALCLAEV